MSNGTFTVGRTVDVMVHDKVHRGRVVKVAGGLLTIKFGKRFEGHSGEINPDSRRYWFCPDWDCQLAF